MQAVTVAEETRKRECCAQGATKTFAVARRRGVLTKGFHDWRLEGEREKSCSLTDAFQLICRPGMAKVLFLMVKLTFGVNYNILLGLKV